MSILGGVGRRRRLGRLALPAVTLWFGGGQSRGGQFMARLFVIVSRTEPARHTYLKHVFGNQTVDVIMDRRVEERRRRQEEVPAERRRQDRRQRDVTKDLQALGWTVVRSPSTSSTR